MVLDRSIAPMKVKKDITGEQEIESARNKAIDKRTKKGTKRKDEEIKGSAAEC